MEKLLHERLMEWCQDDCTAPVYVIALKDACGAAANDAFTAFADEIERDYYAIPRDPDGRPWKFMDEFVVEGNDKVRILYEFKLDKNGWHVTECGTWFPVDSIKRPTPKVYDADGVECKEYEWVWDEAGNEWEILPRPDDAEEGKVWAHNPDGVHKYLDASNLTHREPDSLKRLLNDIREYLATSPVIDSHAREWEKRFAALIERCA